MMILPLGPLSDHLAPVRQHFAHITSVLTPRFSPTRSDWKAVLVVRSLILHFGIEPMDVPHRSILKIGGHGSPLEELDTFATLGSVNLMGLEEVISYVLHKGVAIVCSGVTSPRAYSTDTAPPPSPKAAHTPLWQNVYYRSLPPRSFLPLLRCWPRSRAPKTDVLPALLTAATEDARLGEPI